MNQMSSKINRQVLDDLNRKHNIGRFGIGPHEWSSFCKELIDLINFELNEGATRVMEMTEQKTTRIGLGDIVSVARMEGLDQVIIGHTKTFEVFGAKIVEMIDDELKMALEEQHKRLRQEIESLEFWALLKVQGNGNAHLLKSWTKKPDWLMLSNVDDLQATYSIAQVKSLAEKLEFKVDNWTSYKIMRLEHSDDVSVAK